MTNKFQEYLKTLDINSVEAYLYKRSFTGGFVLDLGFYVKIPNTRIVMYILESKKFKEPNIAVSFYLQEEEEKMLNFSEITNDEISKVKELMVSYFQMLDLDLNHCKALKILNMNTSDEYKALLEYYMLRTVLPIEETNNDFEGVLYIYYLRNVEKINVNEENEAYVKSLDFTMNYGEKLLEPEFNDLLRNNSEDNWKEMIELNYAK